MSITRLLPAFISLKARFMADMFFARHPAETVLEGRLHGIHFQNARGLENGAQHGRVRNGDPEFLPGDVRGIDGERAIPL